MGKRGARVADLYDDLAKDRETYLYSIGILGPLRMALDTAGYFGKLKEHETVEPEFFDRWFGLENMAVLKVATLYLGPVLRRSAIECIGNQGFVISNERRRIIHFVLTNAKSEHKPISAVKTLVVLALHNLALNGISIESSGRAANAIGYCSDYLDNKHDIQISVGQIEGAWKAKRRKPALKRIGMWVEGQKR